MHAEANQITTVSLCVEKIIIMEVIQLSMDEMHQDVTGKVTKNRVKQINAHYKNANIVRPSFTMGEFFAHSKITKQRTQTKF